MGVKRVLNTYTKSETDQRIELSVAPVVQDVAENRAHFERLDGTLTEVEKLLARVDTKLSERRAGD